MREAGDCKDMPGSKKEWALYRCRLSCGIGKRACERIDVPPSVDRGDWIFYQLFAAIEDLAVAVGSE